jgi:hypothetical protein
VPFKQVRGVHAVEDIGEEEVIVEVPLSCLITVEMGKVVLVVIVAVVVVVGVPRGLE